MIEVSCLGLVTTMVKTDAKDTVQSVINRAEFDITGKFTVFSKGQKVVDLDELLNDSFALIILPHRLYRPIPQNNLPGNLEGASLEKRHIMAQNDRMLIVCENSLVQAGYRFTVFKLLEDVTLYHGSLVHFGNADFGVEQVSVHLQKPFEVQTLLH